MTQKEIRMPLLSFFPPHVYVEGRMHLWDLNLDLPQLPANAFGIARFSVATGCASPVDSHLSHEIWIVVSGEAELLYDGRVTRLAQNDACYIQPQESHQVRNDGEVDFIAISIWWR